MKRQGYFITGTDTGVGKTRAAVALCRAFAMRGVRVAAMKPVASGCNATPAGLRNEDALALQAAANVAAPYVDINPYAFAPAIAPHIAAAVAGAIIDLEVLDEAFGRLQARSDVIVVEGAGGWLAPLDAQRSFADLAARWHLEVVLVVGLRLGCLNHALLSVEAIERRGLRLAGWIGNHIDPAFGYPEANLATLASKISAPRVGLFPHDGAALPVCLDIDLLSGSASLNRKSMT